MGSGDLKGTIYDAEGNEMCPYELKAMGIEVEWTQPDPIPFTITIPYSPIEESNPLVVWLDA